MKKYDKLIQFDNDFKPIQDIVIKPKLEAGVYQVNQTPQGELYFTHMKNQHDGLIDLPNTEYDLVVKELGLFLEPSTEAAFEEFEFLYKRSTLLHGLPGTGKTCIVNRVADTVVREKNGIVLFNPNPRLVREAFNVIESLQPESLVMVIFEELDQLVHDYESELLNLLDGEIQKRNIIYMATTNYFDKVPTRLKRPGRFSSCIEVGFPKAETRRFYLEQKLKGHTERLEEWVEKTEGFSIDELKETVLATMCLKQDLDAVINRLKNLKSMLKNPVGADEGYDDDEWYEEHEDIAKVVAKKSREMLIGAVGKPPR